VPIRVSRVTRLVDAAACLKAATKEATLLRNLTLNQALGSDDVDAFLHYILFLLDQGTSYRYDIPSTALAGVRLLSFNSL
jgi:hypothetical protein